MIAKWIDRRVMIPCLITGFRIVGVLCLVFAKVLSPAFYVIYTFSGISDALDGWIARKTGTVSEFGARLDSIADLLFYFVMLIKLFPQLWKMLPMAVWYAVGVILILRLISYMVAAVKYRCFAALHTYLNKLTGFAVFLIPYLIGTALFEEYCYFVCAVAVLAAVEELLIHVCAQ